MKFKFIGNASGIFIGSSGTEILCDPWIKDGVFEGSWFHYPPLKTNLKELHNVDAIYLSHIHPDHYDQRYFNFPKEKPIIILDEGPNFLKKNLLLKGYKNIISIKNNETKQFNEFKLTLFKPFVGHIFEESLLGNLIDSSIVFQDENYIAINFNDNTPDKAACIKLKKKFKKINLVLINYNAAGPYPSCFDNLSIQEKKKENKRILNRNFKHICNVLPYLNPIAVLPFAGSYVLGGKNYKKNDYLGTTTWEVCAEYLTKNLKTRSDIICMRENQIYDLKSKKNFPKYKKLDLDHMKKYIKKIKSHKYDYEKDKIVNYQKLEKDILDASEKFKDKLIKFKIKLNTNIFLKYGRKIIKIYNGNDKKKMLTCEMDSRLIRRILDKKSHWNNAEIGAHISFKRYPNKMEPDVHTSLSFFHL